jgi:hypothetical protein
MFDPLTAMAGFHALPFVFVIGIGALQVNPVSEDIV